MVSRPNIPERSWCGVLFPISSPLRSWTVFSSSEAARCYKSFLVTMQGSGALFTFLGCLCLHIKHLVVTGQLQLGTSRKNYKPAEKQLIGLTRGLDHQQYKEQIDIYKIEGGWCLDSLVDYHLPETEFQQEKKRKKSNVKCKEKKFFLNVK